MQLSQMGVDLIQKWEGCRERRGEMIAAYRCPAGIWTIGYGTTRYPDGTPVREGDRMTFDQATEYLRWECQEKARGVARLVRVPLAQHQFDALVSLAYNIGLAALADSTLLRKLNGGDVAGAAAQFLVWDKATVNGQTQVMPGLAARRREEAALFRGETPDQTMGQSEERPWPRLDRLLQPGDRDHPAIHTLQARLQALGYDCGAIDGVFGDDTARAVRQFQDRVLGTADGKVGPQTWAALGRDDAPRGTGRAIE